MSRGRRWWRAAVLASVTCLIVEGPRGASAASSAESLFVVGAFEAADSAWAIVLESQPSDTLALMRRAQIALFRNRTAEARAWAERAAKAGVTPSRVASVEAETYYRENRFAEAATAAARAGRTAVAAKLAALQRAPYQIHGPLRSRIPFDQTDPLPLVLLAINGRGPFLFVIDTGGSELLLDPTIADSVGARHYGADSALFAADQRARYEHGSVDSVRLGEFTVRHVPIRMLPTRKFAAVAQGRVVAGVLGTTLLSRFRFTLDYPGGALVLERRESATTSTAPPPIQIPFWLAGDHFMLARGSLGSSGPLLWFLDTGLAGAAFTAPPSTLASAGIALKDTAAFTGEGGGGSVRVIPFRVDSLRLGPIEQSGLLAMLGPFPPSLERSLGPRVAGLVSHAFLRPYRVTFDFDRMTLSLARPR